MYYPQRGPGKVSSRLYVAPARLSEADVFPVLLSTLKINTVLDFDLYRRHEVSSESHYILYRHRARPFTEDISQKLVAYGVDRLYIPHRDRSLYESQCDDVSLEEAERQIELMRIEEARRVYRDVSHLTCSLFRYGPVGVPLPEIRASVQSLTEFVQDVPDASGYLLGLENEAPELHRHSINVAVVSIALARAIGMKNLEILQSIGIGGLMHDIGMLQIPLQLREKQGTLSRSERLLLKQHPDYGIDLIHDLRGIHWISRQIIHRHHEKCDRTGYPDGLSQGEIHIGARIVSQAEIYDALTSPRAYGETLSPKEALELMIREMRGELDHRLLLEMIQLIGTMRVPRSGLRALPGDPPIRAIEQSELRGTSDTHDT